MNKTITEHVNRKLRRLLPSKNPNNPLESAILYPPFPIVCGNKACKMMLSPFMEAWYYNYSYYCCADCLITGTLQDK